MRRVIVALAVLVLGAGFFDPGEVQAKGQFAARFVQEQGKEIILQVTMGSPPPRTLIVLQRVPTDAVLLSATPEPKQYKRKKGEIRWLVKNPGSGEQNFVSRFYTALTPEKLSAMVRCKDPESGELMTLVVP